MKEKGIWVLALEIFSDYHLLEKEVFTQVGGDQPD